MKTKESIRLANELRRKIGKYAAIKERVLAYEIVKDIAYIKVLPSKGEKTIRNTEEIFSFASYYDFRAIVDIENSLPVIKIS